MGADQPLSCLLRSAAGPTVYGQTMLKGNANQTQETGCSVRAGAQHIRPSCELCLSLDTIAMTTLVAESAQASSHAGVTSKTRTPVTLGSARSPDQACSQSWNFAHNPDVEALPAPSGLAQGLSSLLQDS